jgi:triphosphoribosyl-dephospho-CoA synthetase
MNIQTAAETPVSIKGKVIHDVLTSLEDLDRLQPSLTLLDHPELPHNWQHLLKDCYQCGEQQAQQDIALTALPNQLLQASTLWLQGFGVLCAAAGRMAALDQPLTCNRLCDLASQLCIDLPAIDSEARDGFYTIRSVALPAWRRLLRDRHSSDVCIQQTLLHLLAWKSDVPGVRQQAQRLLWMGGVLGEKGITALLKLDNELSAQHFSWAKLWALLAITGFLARYPAGPIFVD